MGNQAKALFDQAEAEGGLPLKIRLATLAKLTSTEAGGLPDSQELLPRIGAALVKARSGIIRRFGEELTEAADAKQLRGHLVTLLELMSQRALFLGDDAQTVRRVDEAAARTLNIARVSVWFLDDAASKITCADLFEVDGGQHSSGAELFAKDFAPYFHALATERTIAAHEAQTDPRTACLAPYFVPLSITSMLDVPIWKSGRLAGVICHEHVGAARRWTADEERFAYLLAGFVSLALERA